jgi:hypothetical protein
MKREIAKNIIAIAMALFIILAPAILTWIVDTFVDYITK